MPRGPPPSSRRTRRSADCKAPDRDYNAHFDSGPAGLRARPRRGPVVKELCMAEDKGDLGDIGARRLPVWVELFRAFHIAIDYRKVVLAALGLLAMSVGWWLLSEAFYQAQKTPPDWKSGAYGGEDKAKEW